MLDCAHHADKDPGREKGKKNIVHDFEDVESDMIAPVPWLVVPLFIAPIEVQHCRHINQSESDRDGKVERIFISPRVDGKGVSQGAARGWRAQSFGICLRIELEKRQRRVRRMD